MVLWVGLPCCFASGLVLLAFAKNTHTPKAVSIKNPYALPIWFGVLYVYLAFSVPISYSKNAVAQNIEPTSD
jgi:hypothetical protein